MRNATEKVFLRIPSTTTPSADGTRHLQFPFQLLESVLPVAGWEEVQANRQPERKNHTFAHGPFMVRRLLFPGIAG